MYHKIHIFNIILRLYDIMIKKITMRKQNQNEYEKLEILFKEYNNEIDINIIKQIKNGTK